MIVTLDTNILLYSLDHRVEAKFRTAHSVIDAVAALGGPIGLQVCGEFYHVSTRRFRIAPWVAAQAARNLMTSFPLFVATAATTAIALAEAAAGRFSYWDAALVCAAEAAGCTHVLSEDMHDGTRLGRLEIVNPFGPAGISDRARALLSL